MIAPVPPEVRAAADAKRKARAARRRNAGLCYVCRQAPRRAHGRNCPPCHVQAERKRQRRRRVERRRAAFRIVHENPAYIVELAY